MNHENRPIYLDHNASTPLLPAVLEVMMPYLQKHYGNPSSTHVFGQTLRTAIEQARAQVAELVACSPGEIVFTSGGTEANNLAIRGVTQALPARRQLVTSVIEHPATAAPCDFLESKGYRVHRVPVDGMGRVETGSAREVLSDATALLTMMHANSETGSLQPIREVAAMAHSVGALVHCDAAQSCGKVALRVDDEGIDLMSIAGHKLYAPQGVGALYLRSGTPIHPLVRGAEHEKGWRPGTENVAAIVGLGKACDIARLSQHEEGLRVTRLRDRLWNRLQDQVPGLVLNGHPIRRLPNTLNLRFPRVSGVALLAACPAIAASTGSACHAGGESASAVILAMGIAPRDALGSVRLTLGRGNTADEIDQAADALVQAWQRLVAGK